MKKTVIILSILFTAVVIAGIIIRQNFKNSPEFNYITAKMDIQNGNARIINFMSLTQISEDSTSELIAQKYGFKNIYLTKETSSKILTGIENYNSVIEEYLKLRNGNNWREKYKEEVDSVRSKKSKKP